ncbi:4'-phosphopantetheinyl transferase family protein [Microbulbifer epialgicus]|uniref:Enterobactin synthase component D n=1 Tax=Microbulbifer epialgicus TaxID=393907 RepID=A0ABV4P6D2_9GAMM
MMMKNSSNFADLAQYNFISKTEQISLSGFSDVLWECQYNPEHYDDQLFTKLGISFPEEIRRSIVKRKAEFLSGRHCAQLALKQLGYDNTEIPIGDRRAPRWPHGLKGSITHAGNIALCALSINSESVGIDYELLITDKTATGIKGNIVNLMEEARLSYSGMSINHWLTIAFSIKESLFKALYPIVNQYFDFLDAEITNINEKEQILSLTLKRDLCTDVRSGQIFNGRYYFHRSGILTLMEY